MNVTAGTTKAPVFVCEDYDTACPELTDACVLPYVPELCPLTCGSCQGPRQCRVCSDGFCGDAEFIEQCPDDQPFCVSNIINDATGVNHISKGCASQNTCDTLWLGKTDTDRRCTYYDLDTVYTEKFNCTYCCVENDCNTHVVPIPDTQYRQP